MEKMQVFSVNSGEGFIWEKIMELEIEKSEEGCNEMPAHCIPAGGNEALMMMLSSELILHVDPS